VTRVGTFLRKTRLDELPQLWNVLRGEMSVVGPRPERPEFLDLLCREVPFWTSRQLVKPGITGWAQVRLGYTSDAAGAVDKLSYDLYYLRHRNLLVDLFIVVRTARIVGLGFLPQSRRRSGNRVDQALPTECVPSARAEGLLATALISEARRARDGRPPPSS
jgi:lipopolysaccharide/colanic/teichoic acid biosynthesis glycosyltransferase